MGKTNVQRVNPYSPSASFENKHMHDEAYKPQRDNAMNQQISSLCVLSCPEMALLT